MSTRKKAAGAAEEEKTAGTALEGGDLEAREAAPEREAREAAGAAEEETREELRFPSPCVYCGPTVRGVSRQYTTYVGGVPEELEAFVRRHPEARGLIVSVDSFPTVRERLNRSGTAEAILFRKLRAKL